MVAPKELVALTGREGDATEAQSHVADLDALVCARRKLLIVRDAPVYVADDSHVLDCTRR